MSTATTADGAPASAGGTSYGTPGYRLYVLLMLTLVYTLNFVDRNLLNVIGQPIINEFGLDDATYGFLNGPPFAIFYAFMGLPIAMAADRMNRVVIMALCISIWSVMAAMCGLATSFAFLLAARIGVAIGEAGGTPPSNSIIGDYFKPKSRANALGIFAMGVTIGSALSNYFGGPIAANLNGPVLKKAFSEWGWDWAVNLTNWDTVEGWRVAFIIIGAPGILVALLLLLTVKEPPRGLSDPPGTKRVEKASMMETLKELGPKPTFWNMAIAASLTALVGYGLTGFQAPMTSRIHEIPPGQFAWEFGGPLALWSAAGTFAGGFLVDRISSRVQSAVAIVPAIGLLIAIPLYIFAWNVAPDGIPGPPAQTDAIYTIGRPLWCAGAFFHFMYLGSQYTIGQGVVSQRGRASAIAIMLLMIALIGNGLGPQIVGWLSDMFMQNLINQDPNSIGLQAPQCRVLLTGREGFTVNYAQIVGGLNDAQKAICTGSYGQGLKQSMIYTALIFIPAAIFFLLSAITLKKDMIAKTH